ncbi:MAG: GNAT family N-acetyltransferase [Gemmatimonadota bacterium]
MEQGEEFADWFSDLTLRGDEETGAEVHLEDHYLVLSNEIGDWIGGLRYYMRGGVAHILEIAVTPEQRHVGHAHRLVEAFEERALDGGAHLAEFWTDDLDAELEMIGMGWQRILRRDNYIGERTWYLMEKALIAGS